MELYIRIKDGKPFEHPIFGDNFRQAFPAIDTENLPPEFARFVRVAPPTVGVFEVCDECVYELVDGVYTDVHNVRPMTAEEKAARIAQARASLPPNWTLNEETLRQIPSPPPPKPTTGGPWRFDRQTHNWIVATEPPFPSWTLSEDGTRYMPPTPSPEGLYYWDEPTLSWIKLDV